MDDQPKQSDAWPAGWDSHRIEQIVFTARNTTPYQRLCWLDDMLNLLRPRLEELRRNGETVEAARQSLRSDSQ